MENKNTTAVETRENKKINLIDNMRPNSVETIPMSKTFNEIEKVVEKEEEGCKCALAGLLSKGLCEYCDKKTTVKCDGYVKTKSKRTDEDDVKVIPQNMACVKTHNNVNLVVISKENMLKVLNASHCIVIDNTVICVED